MLKSEQPDLYLICFGLLLFLFEYETVQPVIAPVVNVREKVSLRRKVFSLASLIINPGFFVYFFKFCA